MYPTIIISMHYFQNIKYQMKSKKHKFIQTNKIIGTYLVPNSELKISTKYIMFKNSNSIPLFLTEIFQNEYLKYSVEIWRMFKSQIGSTLLTPILKVLSSFTYIMIRKILFLQRNKCTKIINVRYVEKFILTYTYLLDSTEQIIIYWVSFLLYQ